MKTTKKLLSLLLVMAMLFSLAVPVLAEGETKTATAVTKAEDFVSGEYIVVANNGYALGVIDGTWVTSADCTSGVDAASAPIWTLTVEGNSVKIKDANGVYLAPKGGNNNGISAKEYDWAWSFEDNAFVFAGTGADTVKLANNPGDTSGHAFFFRAYKTGTISLKPDGYPCHFTLYKVEKQSEATPCELTTNINDLQFTVGVAQEFTLSTVANDDAGKMVIGTSVFEHNDAVEKIEYYEPNGANPGWYELNGIAFGPATGFPVQDATSRFRVTFKEAGSFPVTANIEDLDGTVISTVEATFNVAENYNGKTVILHTNDVHGAIADYSKIAALKSEFEAKGANVILADAGDYSQGTTYVSTTKGADAIDMMNVVGYDVATLGNHEFDYGWPQLKENMSKANFKVLCADVFENGSTIFDGHTIIEKGGVKIGFFGMETPEAQTKTNPALIKGLSFLAGDAMYACAQEQVNALKAEGADVIVCLSHLGLDGESAPNRSVDMLAKVSGIDMVIDGHSHTVITATAEQPIQSTGTAFANVGVIVVDNETKAICDNYLVKVDDNTPADDTVAAAAQVIIDRVKAEYGQVFAKSEIELNGDKAPGNRNMETNLGDLITDSMVWQVMQNKEGLTVDVDHVVAITNGGGIRAWIHTGDITKNDVNTVLPFGNTIAVVYVTGAELLEALEASTYCTPAAVGGFPQVAGIDFTVNTGKEYDANADTYPGSTYYGPASINRVTINSINGKAFSETDTYAVITNNFCAAGGDTYYAFAAASAQFDTGIPLDEALMAYITEELGGVVGANYAEPQGRITIKAKESAWDQKVVIGGTQLNLWFTKYGNTYCDCTVDHFLKTDDNGFGFEVGDIVTVKFLDQELDLPVVMNYSDVDSGKPCIKVSGQYVEFAINMGNFGSTYGLVDIAKDADGNYVITAKDGVTFPVEMSFAMAEKGGYLAEYLMHQLTRTNDRADYPDLTDAEFANFRVVATTGMGENVLYRGSSPINPEIGRNTYADAALKDACVTVVMNLADSEDMAKAYEGFSESYYAGQRVIYLNLGVDFTAPEFKAGLAEGLRYFANNEGVYYVHCTEGKDRCGFVSALLECLMGASYDEVVADYMVTYANYYGVQTGTEQYTAIANSNIVKTLSTAFAVEDLSKADLQAEAIEFMKELGLNDTEIADLQRNLGAASGCTEHVWGEWSVMIPSCVTGGGLDARVCEVCGEVETRETQETPDDHSNDPFTDIATSFWHDDVIAAEYFNLVYGYGDGTFRPDTNITRAQFVTLLWRAAGCPDAENSTLSFADAGTIAEPYRAAVAWGVEMGIIKGFADNTFRPNESITRAQMATFTYRLLLNVAEWEPGEEALQSAGFVDEASISKDYIDAVNAMAYLGIMVGVDEAPTFNGNGVATRGMAAAVLLRTLFAGDDSVAA